MWQEPKTDWGSTDNFNVDDYNRILGNVTIIKELVQELYVTFEMDELSDEKVYGDWIYADEINAIEQNLDAICEYVYPFDIGERKTYYPNQPTTDWKEINRIESACLPMYKFLTGQKAGKMRLAITLGGGKIR